MRLFTKKEKALPAPPPPPTEEELYEYAQELCALVTDMMRGKLPRYHSFYIDRTEGTGKHKLIITKWGAAPEVVFDPTAPVGPEEA
jgi:hypothetical protein